MVQHIYGNTSVLNVPNRPNLFVNELKMYADYLRNEIADFSETLSAGQIKKWKAFKENLLNGIQYYQGLLTNPAVLSETNAKAKEQFAFYTAEVEGILIPELAVA
jgi:hypothetical protein